MANQRTKQKQTTTPPPVNPVQSEPAKVMQLPGWAYYVFIFLFTCMIYGNTLWDQFAIDDTIVLTDNKFTKKGFGGIKDHFTHDMFEGFFGERGARLVSGGRYRPLSMASLTVEYEIVRRIRGDKREEITDKNVIIGGEHDPYLAPMLSHGINVLLFAITCILLYHILLQIIPRKYSITTPIGILSVPFLATLLYAAHPIHTEAVSNIKGRDEVMCMLFTLLSLLAAFKYVKTQNIVHLLWGVVVFFLGLLSKENSVTFLAIIPLTYFFFTKAKVKDYVLTVGLYLIPVVIFLFLRNMYTQAGLTQDSPEVLNNPFLLAVKPDGSPDLGLRYGTTILTFLLYFKLLVFPHPLTHDYYFNQIPLVGFDDPWVLVSIVVTFGLVAYALFTLMEKSVASYAILFYFITFSIASNVLFTVGVLMNERFVYMSSLGFCILVAFLLVKSKDRFKISPNAILGVFVVLLLLYSAKTFSRNTDWKDSFTLFRRDCIHSPNSAKIQTSVGGDLTKAADWPIPLMRDSGMIKKVIQDLSDGCKSEAELNAINALPDSSIRHLLLDSSIQHLYQAVTIYKTHSNAWLLLGNAMYKRDHKPEEVIPIYEKAMAFRVGGYYDAAFNLGIVYNESNQAAKAKENLLKAYDIKPESMEVRFLLSQAYSKLNMPDSVEYWLKRGSELKKPDAADYYLIGTGYGKVGGNLPMAIEYLKKAIELNPKAELYYEDLGVAYGINRQFDEAIATSNKLLEINPKYPAAYKNLSISYGNKGNKALADEYQKKYEESLAAVSKK